MTVCTAPKPESVYETGMTPYRICKAQVVQITADLLSLNGNQKSHSIMTGFPSQEKG